MTFEEKIKYVEKEIRHSFGRTYGLQDLERQHIISNDLQTLHSMRYIYDFKIVINGSPTIYYKMYKGDQVRFIVDFMTIRKEKLERILND